MLNLKQSNPMASSLCVWKFFFLPLYLMFMSFTILILNCQGAASLVFRRSLISLISLYNPSILVLVEPRISGWSLGPLGWSDGGACVSQ